MAIKRNKITLKRKCTSVPRRTTKRPQMQTKEQLIEYLEQNIKYGFELPFVQEAWDKAEENFNKPKEKKYDQDGKEKKTIFPNSIVACYFQVMGFRTFINIGKEILKNSDVKIIPFESDLSEEEVAERSYEEERDVSKNNATPLYKNWLINWINCFNEEESSFLRQRFADYYNQYDINEAADKTVLMNILSTEIQLYRINIFVSKGKIVNMLEVEKLNKSLINLLEAQKWTKKQRSASDDAVSNKFTVWLEKAMKEGKFIETKTEYKPDDIEKLLKDIIKAMTEVSM